MGIGSREVLRDAVDALCAQGAVERALLLCRDTSRQPGDVPLRATALLLRGDLLLRLGRHNEAMIDFVECRDLARTAGSEGQDLLADTSYYLALSTDATPGEEFLGVALSAFEQMIADGQREPAVLGRLARLYEETGRLDAARGLYDEARRMAAGAEAVHFAAALACVTGRLEGYAAGRRLFEEACYAAERHPEAGPSTFWEFAMFEWESEHYSDALLFFRASLEVLDKDPVLARNRLFLAEVHWRIARIYYADSELDEAIDHCTRVLPNAADAPRFAGGAHLLLGHCFAARGDAPRAAHHYRECLANPATPEDERRLALDGLQQTGAGGRA